MKKSKLKPCPFCGCKDIDIDNDFLGDKSIPFAFCVKCGVMVEKNKWNRRPISKMKRLIKQEIEFINRVNYGFQEATLREIAERLSKIIKDE